MDPITTAIAAALAAGAVSGATEAGKQALVDAYGELKSRIKKKFGADSKIVKAVTELEDEPGFKPNQEALAGRVEQSQADQDAEILAAAQALLEQLKAAPGGEQHIMTATGNFIAQADRGGTATVSVNRPGAGDD
jgi:hypothetical protein